MTKTIDTLVDDIYALFNRDDIEISDEDAHAFGVELANIIKDRVSSVRKPQTLRMSNVGDPCHRKLHLKINTPEVVEPLPPQASLKFLYGDILESLLLFLAKIAGHTVEGRQDKLSIGGVEGHRDAIIDGNLVDVKSASTFSFKKFEKGITPDDDPFNYTTQLNLYLEASKDDPRLKVKHKAYFLAIDKTLGHICLSPLNKDTRNWEAQVLKTKEKVNGKELPPRAYIPEPEGKSGNMALGTVCSYCDVKSACYPGLRTFVYSSGPKFFTKVLKEPNVPEVK